MEWTRRQFVAAGLAAPGLRWHWKGARSAVARVKLTSAAPWKEIESLWGRMGLGLPERVVARACMDWWPSGAELPDRWAAWLEFSDGRVLVAECRPRERVREPGPRAGFQGGEAVARALRGG